MLRSMTAYVSKSFTIPQGFLTFEIQSLNRKFLEIVTTLDPLVAPFEIELKKMIAEKVHRGKVNVRISFQLDKTLQETVVPNLQLARGLKSAWEEIAREVGAEFSFDLSFLKNQEKLFSLAPSQNVDIDTFKQQLYEKMSQVLEELVNMKLQEGFHLYMDINQRISGIEELIDKISNLSKGEEENYRKKLLGKINHLLETVNENEDRILREVCLIADKLDITEEIVRLKAHITQFKAYLDTSSLSISKKLEFLLIEMMREANTIASKTVNQDAIHLIVEVKTELEKIKEQLQNID